MDLELIRNYCLGKKRADESLPFNKDSPVYKVMEKIFLISNLNPPYSINVKCDPEKAIELRERYDAVIPGYHMNKKHWNTVLLDNPVGDNLIYEWIDDSYNLVTEKLNKTNKEKLKNL